MKNFANLLFGYLLLTNPSFSMALSFGSFQPREIFQASGYDTNNYFGFAVSTAGDINNDGYDDILVGAYGTSGSQGAVYVIYGGEISSMSNIDLATQPLNPLTTGFMITGNAAGDCFGYSASTAGDINNDGYDDIIVGAYGKNSNQGAAYVIYGGEKSTMSNIVLGSTTLDPLTTGFMITGSAASDQLGYSVSSAGDINNDGYDDIIVGAMRTSSNRGAAYVIYGGPKSTMSNWDFSTGATLTPSTTGFMITGNAALDYLGNSVGRAGDVNNDEYDDIIVGAYGKNSFQGAVYVIYGGGKSAMSNVVLSTTPLNPTSTGFMITGNAFYDSFGTVSSAGDINNDGYDDIIIGAWGKNSYQGAAYVIYGGEKSTMSDIVLSSTILDPLTTGFMIRGGAGGDRFGFSVGTVGDVNKDGYHDIIIGAYGKNSNQGAVYVVYGGQKSSMSNIDLATQTQNLKLLTTGFMVPGDVVGDQLGSSISRAGDINNDGYDDFIIGALGKNSNKGATYLILGPFKCPKGCNNCNSPSSCSSCSQGYVFENSLCSQCPTNCDSCSSPSSCDTCTTPYLLYHGQCDFETCPLTAFAPDIVKCEDCPYGCSICSNTLTCEECLDGYTRTDQQKCQMKVAEIKIKEKDGEKAAAGVFEGTSLVGASLSSGSSLPFNFGLVAKIMRNFKYMALPVSRELQETFVSWKVASGFMSAPKSWSEKYSSKTIPTVFSRYGLQSAFLVNFWKPFSMALVGIAVFAIFKAIEISLSKGNEKKSTLCTISRHVNVAASNFALTQFYSNLDDVLFYFILEMRSTEFETGFRVCSSLLAILFLVVGGIIIGVHWKLVARYQSLKEKGSAKQLKGFESKCENINLIFKDFKDANSLVQSFLMINVARSIVSSLIFATLFESPMIQISFLFVLNILMLVYLWKKKSFKELTNTCGQIFCEVILFIANICVFLLALFDHANSYPLTSIENLGKCIIVLNYILLFGCALLLLVNLGKMLYQSYVERKNGAKVFQAPISTDSGIFTSEKFKNPEGLPALTQSDHNNSTNGGFINESQINFNHSDLDTNNHMKTISYYNQASPERQASNMNYKQGISSNFINEAQTNFNHSDSYSNNNPMKTKSNENHAGRDIHSSNMRPQQDISSHYSVQNRNLLGDFGRSNPNVGLQSSQTEDFGEETRDHVLPRSRLLRNREITKARIAQFSSSPERRIQDPSF